MLRLQYQSLQQCSFPSLSRHGCRRMATKPSDPTPTFYCPFPSHGARMAAKFLTCHAAKITRANFHMRIKYSKISCTCWTTGRSRKLTFCLKQIYLTLTLCFLKAWLPTLEAKTSWPLKASKTWTAAAWTWATFRLSLSMGAEIGSRFSLFAWQNIANEAQKLKPWSWSLFYLWFLWFSLPSCLHLSSRSSLKRFSAFLSTPCHWQLCPWAASCRQGWPGIWSGCIAALRLKL